MQFFCMFFFCLLFSLSKTAWSSSTITSQQVPEVSSSNKDDTTPPPKRLFWDPFSHHWKPLTSEFLDLAVYWGGEGRLNNLSTPKLPTQGGGTLNIQLSYFRKERLGVATQLRMFLGLAGETAVGTNSSFVVSPLVGFRYQLVRENRFSLSLDCASGPSFFWLTDIQGDKSTWGLGGEINTAVAFRYALGILSAELRPLLGARGGARSSLSTSQNNDALQGPFSLVYAGVDMGISVIFDVLAYPEQSMNESF